MQTSLKSLEKQDVRQKAPRVRNKKRWLLRTTVGVYYNFYCESYLFCFDKQNRIQKRMLPTRINCFSHCSFQVAWLRVDTQTILTISTHVITKNHRITVNHMGRTWFLHIKDTRVSDRGLYMCQVNTDPMSSITGVLTVVGEQ